MKRSLLAVLFYFTVVLVLGQTDGSYKSRQSGNWNQQTTWQVFNSGWSDLESPGAGIYQNVLPSSISGIITISSNTTVTIPNQFEVDVDQLEFGSAAVLHVTQGGLLNIQNGSGHDVRLYNDETNFSKILVSGVVRLLGATMVNDNYAGVVLPASHATTINTYQVQDGGLHIHASADALPYADWQTGSTITYYATNTNPTITDVSVSFYNFIWNGSSQTQNLTFSSKLRNVKGNLTINGTNGRTLHFGTVSSYTLNIGGDFNVTGNPTVYFINSATAVINIGSTSSPGNFHLSSGTLNCTVNGATTLNVAGDVLISGGKVALRTQTTTGFGSTYTNLNVRGNLIQTGGTLTRSVGGGLAYVNFTGVGTASIFSKIGTGTISNAIHFTVANGKTLDLGTSALTGSGSITLLNGATLHVGSLDPDGAIQNNTTGGNIRVSGTRAYQTGSTIVYNGTGNQFMGQGHPASVNTIIDNGNTVTMISDININGALDVQSGVFVILSHALTVGGG